MPVSPFLAEIARIDDASIHRICAITHLILPSAQHKICIVGERDNYHVSQERFISLGRVPHLEALVKYPGFFRVFGAPSGTRAIIHLEQVPPVGFTFVEDPQRWIRAYCASQFGEARPKLRRVS